MELIVTDQQGWYYAESAMLQDHCDSLHSLAADLRTLAKQLTKRAEGFDDRAYQSRKRKFDASRGEPSSDYNRQAKENMGDIDRRIRDAAATIEIAQMVKAAVKSMIKGSHGQKSKMQDIQDAAARQGDASAIDTVSAITNLFTERLLQEHQRQAILSAKSPSRHQKYIGPNGLPLCMDEATCVNISCTASSWKSVNGQNWGKFCSPSLEMDGDTQSGLLQRVTKDSGIQRSLILRAATRLQRNGRDSGSEDVIRSVE